ncbi:MAG: NuoM family protein [Phycisphaerae bacterium]
MSALSDSFLGQHILTLVVFLPVLGGVVLFARTSWDSVAIRRWAFGVSLATLAAAILACALFLERGEDLRRGGYVLEEHLDWIVGGDSAAPFQIQYKLGVDGISLPLLMLTALLTPLAVWGSFTSIQTRHREYYALMLLLHGAMLGVFCARDLLLFYVFFEFTLVPLYFLIGIWGGPQRRKAANMFFLYTLAGSMLTFAGVLYLGWQASLHTLGADGGRIFTFDLDALYALAADGYLSPGVQWWLFIAFFAGFAIKVPLFPFHTWLPLAHVEAPTAGSVILAAVLLKLGTYGFLRLSLPMLPDATLALAPAIGLLAVVGILYGALAAWVQGDIKKLVAYSSVSHLGFCLLGMFSLKMAGLTGSLFYMINHGLSTGALFLVVGMIYERYHTREMSELGGLARKMPIMAFFLMIFTMSSIGLPGLNGFVSEFLVLLGTFTSGHVDASGPAGPLGIAFAIPAATGILLGAIYMLHMVRRLLFGPVKEPAHGFDASTGLTQDLTRREIGILAPLAACCLLIGVYPKPLMNVTDPSLRHAVLSRVTSSGWGTPEPAVATEAPADEGRAEQRPAAPQPAFVAEADAESASVAETEGGET